jgi:hypothetical protein
LREAKNPSRGHLNCLQAMNSNLRSYETSQISFQTKYNEHFRQRPSPGIISTDNPSTKSFVYLRHVTATSMS